MKKILFAIAILALLFPSFLSGLPNDRASEPQTAQVIAAKADIFLEASQHSIVIDTIPKGTTVTLFPSGKKNKKWLYISYLSEKRGSQVTGFIDSRRVEIVKKAAAPEEEKTQEPEANTEELGDLLTSMQQEKGHKEEKENQAEEAQEEKAEEAEQVLTERKEKLEQAAAEEQKDAEETAEDSQEENAAVDEKKEKETPEQQETEEAAIAEAEIAAREQDVPPEDEKPPVAHPSKTETTEMPKVLTKVAVKVPRANIRLMPTTKSPIIHQAVSGVELEHVAKTANWHRVNLAPNSQGIVLSGYIHKNIVDEILETVTLPDPEPEKRPEPEPEIKEEEPRSEPESEPVQEVPFVKKSSFGKYFWVGGGAGYTMPSQSSFGKGMNFSATVGVGLMKHLAIEFRAPYFQSNVSSSQGGLSSGRLSSLSLMLSVQGRYPIQNRYVPYIVAGGDYHLNRFSLSDEISRAWNDLGFNIQESVDHTFGVHFGVGLDVFLLHNIAVNLDARYYTANLTGSRTLAHLISQETTSAAFNSMKLNSLQAGISIKLFLTPLNKR
jgi:hypothetical protein